MNRRILCVDDDSNVLLGYQRALRKQFSLEVALGGEEALQAVREHGPYAVVVADMRMPGMNGVELLAAFREIAPQTVRMMLTGNADQQTALEAVNQGQIFRFLTKPCPPDAFGKVLGAGLEQYRLIRAEQELLSKTLSGSVKVLTDVLALACPAAFGRASRIRTVVQGILERIPNDQEWMIEIAAMLSQIGCIALADDVLNAVQRGEELSRKDAEAFEVHPLLGRDLLKSIPRLEGVAEIIGYQHKWYDGRGTPKDQRRGVAIPLGSRILKVALDFDALNSGEYTPEMAIAEMLHRDGWYDPEVLDALANAFNVTQAHVVRELSLDQMLDGMILARDVRSIQGTLLCAKGQEVTRALRVRLKNYACNLGIRAPIRVFVPVEIARMPSLASEEALQLDACW